MKEKGERRVKAYSSGITHTLFFTLGGWVLLAPASSGGAFAPSREALLAVEALLSWMALERGSLRPPPPPLVSFSSATRLERAT